MDAFLYVLDRTERSELSQMVTVRHFHEQLGKRHNDTLGYTVTSGICTARDW